MNDEAYNKIMDTIGQLCVLNEHEMERLDHFVYKLLVAEKPREDKDLLNTLLNKVKEVRKDYHDTDGPINREKIMRIVRDAALESPHSVIFDSLPTDKKIEEIKIQRAVLVDEVIKRINLTTVLDKEYSKYIPTKILMMHHDSVVIEDHLQQIEVFDKIIKLLEETN